MKGKYKRHYFCRSISPDGDLCWRARHRGPRSLHYTGQHLWMGGIWTKARWWKG